MTLSVNLPYAGPRRVKNLYQNPLTTKGVLRIIYRTVGHSTVQSAE